MGKGRPFRTAPVVVLLGLLLVQGFAPGWMAQAEAWTVDTRFLLRGVEQPRNPIVIVALDEDFFQLIDTTREKAQGRDIRVLRRADWARLVKKIAAGNPRVIGLDVVFDLPGQDEGGDEALAEALASAGNVVLAARFEQTAAGMYSLTAKRPPILLLEEASAGFGVVDVPVDVDGAVRWVTLLYPWDGQPRPAFPLMVAAFYNGGPIDVGASALGTDLAMPINFRGPERTFITLSAYDDVWMADEPSEEFRDAIVLVGYTTQLEHDRHRSPFAPESGVPGVEINANAIDTLLVGDWLHRAPAWLPLVLVGVMGLAALALLNLRRPGLGVLVLSGVLAAYLALGQALFAWAGFILPLVAPVAAAVAVGGTALAERMVFAERDKRRLRQRFAGVMSEERLQAVMDQWENLLQVERPQKEAAVLFADVRGFTSTTETLMRQGRISEMVSFLTAYLDAMAEAVFAERGVIYDVVGDGLMILFGVPEAFPDYALRAVRGAVRMALATESLQAVWPLRDQRPLRMGIGVHCGPVVDAMVGRGRRINYAVVGDPVNTAARIESHCKVAMEIPRPPGGQVPETVTILLSAELYDKVREHVVADESVPPFEARGKSEPLHVVRVLGLRPESMPEDD